MSSINLSSFIWSVADLLRGDYKQSEYGKVILPFTVLRQLDCVLEATKWDVLAEKQARERADEAMRAARGFLDLVTSPVRLQAQQAYRRRVLAEHGPHSATELVLKNLEDWMTN